MGAAMSDEPPSSYRRNRLLSAMPGQTLKDTLPHLRAVVMGVGDTLLDLAQPVRHVYFPLDLVASLSVALQEGAMVEVAMIGNEGVVGGPLRDRRYPNVRAFTQVGGRALKLDVKTFDQILEDETGRAVIERYDQALFAQVAQTSACNRLHTNEERLSRWLLMCQDRAGADAFPVTHEFLAQMIGAQRPSVTLTLQLLQKSGVIRYRRGEIRILDRQGLESIACECYRIIRDLTA